MAKVINNTAVVTNKALISYAHISEPAVPMNGGEPMYSCCIIIPKTDTETIDAINEAIDYAYKNSNGKFGNKLPNKAALKIPLRDGDIDRNGEGVYANAYFLNAKSKNRPRVLDTAKNEITNPADIYSGMYAKVILNFYPYAASGNKGIGCGLGDMQKVADGERLGGGSTSGEAVFDVLGDTENDSLPF